MAANETKFTDCVSDEMFSNSMLFFRSYVSLKGHVTRQLNKFDQLVQSGVTVTVLEGHIEVAKQKLQKTNEAADNYFRILRQQTAEPDKHLPWRYGQFEEDVFDRLDKLIQFLERLNIKSVSQNALTTSDTYILEPLKEVRLPAIDLPQF